MKEPLREAVFVARATAPSNKSHIPDNSKNIPAII